MAVDKQKGAVPMKSKLVFATLFLALVSVGSVAASEAVWEVHVTAGLPASDFVFPDPLPMPEPLGLASEGTVIAVPVARYIPPVRMPGYKPAVRAGKALFDANLVLMVGLNIADYVSTRQALKYPGLTETNPLMKPFIKSPAAFAAVKFGTTALSYWSMKALFKRNKTVAWIMTTASNALLSYVVANNYRLIQGARVR
jgi:Domain of unknown function (DUF5658)